MGEPSRFGRRLKRFRERAGLSQNRLAQLSGVERVSITLVESGRQEWLTVENTIKIADALNVSLDLLLRGDPLSEDSEILAAIA